MRWYWVLSICRDRRRRVRIASPPERGPDPRLLVRPRLVPDDHRGGVTDKRWNSTTATTVVSETQILASLSSISSTLSLLFGGIAGISLLVGGIGIMNITLVTVSERTREIGVRKAVGAPRRAILAQFLVESVVLAPPADWRASSWVAARRSSSPTSSAPAACRCRRSSWRSSLPWLWASPSGCGRP